MSWPSNGEDRHTDGTAASSDDVRYAIRARHVVEPPKQQRATGNTEDANELRTAVDPRIVAYTEALCDQQRLHHQQVPDRQAEQDDRGEDQQRRLKEGQAK